MKENSFPKSTEKIDKKLDEGFAEAFKSALRDIYGKGHNLDSRISLVIIRLENFFRQLDKNLLSQQKISEIIDSISNLRDSKEIQSENAFIGRMTEILRPFIDARTKYPKEFEEAQVRVHNEEEGYIALNRLVTYEKVGDIIKIHHSQAKTVGPSLRLYYDAMEKLAKIVEDDSEIQRIEAVSWIVKHSPKLFTKNGFSYKEIPKSEYFKSSKNEKDGEGREIAMAFINREDFLQMFLKK